MIKRLFSTLALSIASVFASAPMGMAQQAPADVMQIEVLSGWRTADGTHMAAFRIRMKEGWKTYWRAPGDGGIPPQFDWSGSKNIAGVKFYWPRPKVSFQNDMRSIVYYNEVVIPVEFTLRNSGQDVRLKGRVDMGVCNDICIPISLKFSADLSKELKTPIAAIKSALKAQPIPAKRAGVKSVRCLVEPISDGLRVTAVIKMPSTGGDEAVIIEPRDQGIWVSETKSSRAGNVLTAVSDLVPPSNAPFALDRSRIRLTVLGSNRAVDIMGCTG